jgi:Putative DNA-binding domain
MSRDDEGRRQRALLQALRAQWMDAWPLAAAALPGRRGAPPDRFAGLRVYRANAQAVAQRALAAAYPVLARLVGDETMAALARDLWREHPPTRGDLGWFGAELAGWIKGVAELADLPYLADMARLEWAVHRAHAAADPADAPPDLSALGGAHPENLHIGFVAGHALLASPWPVLTLWQAHQVPVNVAPDLVPARMALAEGRHETAWVWRRGHRVELAALATDEQAFHEAVLAGATLGQALQAAVASHPDFDFERWLTRALREGWLAAIRPQPFPS